MMTDEKLEEIRDTLESDCQESDLVCSIQEAGQTLLAHIDELAGQIAYWQKCYNDLIELNVKEEGACKLALDAKDRQIATLKAALIQERAVVLEEFSEPVDAEWYCMNFGENAATAKKQLAQEYPEIFKEE